MADIKSIFDILKNKSITGDPKNKYEFQAYGNRLADELNDAKHRTLYIKLAKEEDRALLEGAREYALAAEKATTKGKLFMWKLGQLKDAKKVAQEPLNTDTK